MNVKMIKLENPDVMDLLGVINNTITEENKNYTVYVSFCDSLYAVEDITAELDATDEEIDTNIAWIDSRDDRLKDATLTSIEEFKKFLEKCPLFAEIQISSAGNIDESLDLQMDEPCDCIGVSVDDVCKMMLIHAA